MKSVTVFTSNQPRHLNLINELSKVFEQVYAIIETNTVHPGKISDFFKKSSVMQSYFSKVIESENKFFGNHKFLPENVTPLIIRFGDLNMLDFSLLKNCLNSELFLVFGSSYIKGELVDFLVKKNAVNIHMGVSPYYRGSSCNFWAMNNKDYQFVGSTIHMLSKGLDSGKMLFHALPSFEPNPFDYTMKSVKSAHMGLIKHIKNNSLNKLNKLNQNKNLEISYTRNSDFNDDIALNFMKDSIRLNVFKQKVENRNMSLFLNPFIY